MEIDQKGLDFEILKREPTSTSGRIEGETVTVEHGKTFELNDRTRSATFQAQAHLRKHGGLFCWEVTKMALLGISERVGLCFIYFV